MCAPQFLADFLPTLNFLRVGLVQARHLFLWRPSFSNASLPCSTRFIAFFVRLHMRVVQVLPLRSLDPFRSVPPATLDHSVKSSHSSSTSGVDEGAQRSCLSRSQRQFANTFSDDRVPEYLLVELGPGFLDRLRVVLRVADLHRLVDVHLDEPPWLFRDFPPALLLQNFEDRVQDVFASLQIGEQFECIQEILALTLW